jgi:dipeptidyl aminopeptidase/acylaminoacyl peptidase
VSSLRQLASTGPAAASWSSDGSKLYVVSPSGQLSAVPVAGGDAQQVQPNGVSLVKAGPNGPAYVRGGLVVYGQVAVPGLQPIALGFRGGNLAIATADSVVNPDTSKVASFSEAATAAEFSPDGGRIAYLGASGLHVVDLTTQADKLVGPAAGLGDWSPDGRRYAYPTESTVSLTHARPTCSCSVAAPRCRSWPVTGARARGRWPTAPTRSPPGRPRDRPSPSSAGAPSGRPS